MVWRERWGGWIAALQDPDGNILQLLQLPSGAKSTLTVNTIGFPNSEGLE